LSTALVLTTFFPPETEADRGGTHRRVGAVLRALQPRFERIDMLHIPAPGRLTDSAKQSAFWNQPVHTATLTRHEAPAIFFDDNIRGLIDLAWQHPWHRYVSNELIQQLQAQLNDLNTQIEANTKKMNDLNSQLSSATTPEEKQKILDEKTALEAANRKLQDDLKNKGSGKPTSAGPAVQGPAQVHKPQCHMLDGTKVASCASGDSLCSCD